MAHCKTILLKTFIFATIFLLSFALFFGVATSISDAVLSQNYFDKVSKNDYDWHFGENFLDIKNLKTITQSWTEDSNFEKEKIKKDPIVVAVIDTGVNFNHEMFEGKYDSSGRPTSGESIGKYDVFLRDSSGSIVGKNTAVTNGSISDVDFHGTHVTGIVATLIHALDLEEYIKIMPIKASTIADKKSIFELKAVENGIKFALANGADVINMSLGAYAIEWSKLVTAEDAKKAVFVAAAGNDPKSSSTMNGKFFPGASSNVLGVMNYTGKDSEGKILENPVLSNTSNYGSAYDICAPGAGIYSVDGVSADAYKSMSGTSMASPIVAFASALITMKYRAFENVNNYEITPSVVRKMIKAHSKKSIAHKALELPVLDLKSLAEIDFLGDEKYSSVTAIDPSSISITSNDSLEMELGSVGMVNLQCKVDPLGAEVKKIIKWTTVVDGVEITLGEGTDLQFLPPNRVGEYIVKVSIEGTEFKAAIKVIVIYKVITPDKAEIQLTKDISNDNRIALGEKIVFSLKDFNLVDKDKNAILWYVDGVYASFGKEFEYSSLSVGEHVISVKFNNVFLSTKFKLIVDESLPFDVFAVYTGYELFTLAFLSFAALVLFGVVVTILVKGKKLGIYNTDKKKIE